MKRFLVQYPIHGHQTVIVEAESKTEAMRKVAMDPFESIPLDHEITHHSKPTYAELFDEKD